MTPLAPPPASTPMMSGSGINPVWSGWFQALYEWILNSLKRAPVADIDNPIELAALNSNRPGGLLVAYTVTGLTTDKYTLYAWDPSAGAVNVPYVVQGAGGKWVAIGGAYTNP